MTAPHGARVSAVVLLAALGLAGNPSGAGAQSGAANSRTFQWTAPGDVGPTGRPARYELRYSANAVSSAADSTALADWWQNLSAAVPASALPTPSQPGVIDSAVVGGLAYGATYYFIIRSVDAAGNWSPYSNVAAVTLAPCDAPTSTPPQPALQNDSLGVLVSWTPPQDPLASYAEVYRGSSPTRLAFVGRMPAGDGEYRDAAVRKGTTYYYAIAWAATCGTGVVGSASSIAVPYPSTAPAAKAPASSMLVYPNPAPGPLTMRFQINGTSPQPVRIRLYDMNGRWVADLADQTLATGQTDLTWDRQTRGGDRAAPGYYEAIGTIGGSRVRERLVLLP